MRRGKLVLGLAGMALAVGVIAGQDVRAAIDMSVSIGWGLAALLAFEAVPLAIKSQAWRLLLPAGSPVGFAGIVVARWIRQSVSQLLPVAQIGGDAVGARILYLHGVPAESAGAATVVDLTLAVVAQLLVTLIGLTLLIGLSGEDDLFWPVLASAGLLLIGVTGFIIAQHKGMFRHIAARAATFSSSLTKLVVDADRLDHATRRTYGNKKRVSQNIVWQAISQIAGSGEILIICALLGQPVGFAEAFVLHSMTRAARSAAFMIPGGLGVQEGGILLIATVLGLDPTLALSIALLKRVRELMTGLPGLAAWQVLEMRNQRRAT